MTAPSHMTLFTSLYPSVHRINNLGADGNRAEAKRGEVPVAWRIDPRVTTLAELFKAAGWRTAAFHGGGNVNRAVGFDEGFDEFDGQRTNGMNGNAEQPFDFEIAARWLDAHRDEPFFLFLHTYVPHAPYLPLPPWDREFDRDYTGPIPTRAAFFAAMASGDPGPPQPGPDASDLQRELARHVPWQFWGHVDPEDPRELEHLRALYDGDVRTADDALGQMLAKLSSLGLDERTIVVVLSDHGEGFLEHGVFEHPGKLYDELVHVPLAVRVPGLEPRRVPDPVGLIDLAPTLCELAGIAPAPEMRGRSLASELRGRVGAAPATSAARDVWSEFVAQWEQRASGFEPTTVRYALRDDRWTYVATRKGAATTEELFDRRNDPDQRHDLAASAEFSDVLAACRAKLSEHERVNAEERAKLRVIPAGKIDTNTADALRQLGYAR
jgi:arylsulfatase A-like enzyme